MTAGPFKTVRQAQTHTMLTGVRVEIRARAARAWIHVCRVLQYVVGERRAAAWAEAGAWRLGRWRVKGGRWQRFERSPL